MQKLVPPALIAALFFTLATTSWAKVFQTIDNTYPTPDAPIDVAGSADGRYTFVLTDSGKIVIYTTSGENEEIVVSPEFDKIYVSATGDKLWLSSQKTKKVQSILIDFVQKFELDDSPFLGVEKAPVVLTVFSDFQ